MSNVVGQLTIDMVANVARLQRDMEQAKRSVGGAMGSIQRTVDLAKKALIGLGGVLAVRKFASFIQGAIDSADQMSKLSQRIGVSVKDVAGLQLAFRQSGLEAGALQQSMARLSVGIANGNRALTAMGVATRNVDGTLKSTRQVLGDVANQFASYEDGAAKSALAIELFGRAGADMIPLLNGGAEALDNFDAMAMKLGLTLDKETAQAAERFNDTLDLVRAATQGMATQVAAQLLPTLEAMADAFFTLVSESTLLQTAGEAIRIVFQTLTVVGSDLAFVLVQIGKGFVALKDAAAAALTGNFRAAGEVFAEYNRQAQESRAALDRFQATVMGAGSATVAAMAATRSAARNTAPAFNQLEAAAKRQAEAQRLMNKELDDYFKAEEKARMEKERAIGTAREMVEQIEFETAALKMTNTEREIAIRLRELERRGIKEGSREYEEFSKRIREAVSGREAVSASIEQQRRAQQEWDKTWEQIAQSFTDHLMRGGQTVKQYLIDLFRTIVLRPVLAPIGGAFASMLGAPAMAGTAGAGGLSGATGLLGMAGAFGTGMAASFSSMMAAGVGGWATAAGSLIGTGALSGIAAGIGMIAAPLAAAALLFKPLFGSSTRMTGEGVRGTLSADGVDLQTFQDMRRSGGLFRSSRSWTETQALGAEMAGFFDQAVGGIAGAVEEYAAILGLSTDKIKGFAVEIDLSFAGLSEAERMAKIEEALGGFGDALAQTLGAESFSALQQFATAVLNQRNQLEMELLRLQGDTVEIRRRELELIHDTNKELQLRIWALQDERQALQDAQKAADDFVKAMEAQYADAQAATNAALDAVRRSIDAQKQIAMTARDVARESVDSLQTIFNILKDNIEDLYGIAGAGMTAAQGRAFIDQAIMSAQTTGYLPDATELRQAIGAARSGISAGGYATSFEMRRDQLVLAARLTVLRDLTGDQLSVAEKQLLAAEKQIEKLDQQMLLAQQQVDALRGVDNSVMSVEAAISGLSSAMAAERQALATMITAQQAVRPVVPTSGGGGAQAVNSLVNQIDQAYQDIFGREAEASGLAYWASEIQAGNVDPGNLTAALVAGALGSDVEAAAARGFAAGGLHMGGLRMVGENGPELEVTGPARYFSASQTANMMGGGAEVAMEIRGLREENKAQARALVGLQSRMTRLLERWEGDGLPSERVETA
jgi:hypothetical protein